MISFLSKWTKTVGLSVIIVTLLEMLLPENKTKKYIKIVMGTYILFCMISPFFQNKINFDANEYIQSSTTAVNNTSMNKRIEDLYIKELEKEISRKVEEKGIKVNSCKIKATIAQNVEETKLEEIILNVSEETTKEKKEEIKSYLINEYEIEKGSLKIN